MATQKKIKPGDPGYDPYYVPKSQRLTPNKVFKQHGLPLHYEPTGDDDFDEWVARKILDDDD